MPNNYFTNALLERPGFVPIYSWGVSDPGKSLTSTQVSDLTNQAGKLSGSYDKVYGQLSSAGMLGTPQSTPSQTPTPQGIPTPDTSAASTPSYSGANNYSLTPQANFSTPSSGSIYDPSNDPWGLNEYLNLGNLNPAGGTGKGNQFFNQQWFA